MRTRGFLSLGIVPYLAVAALIGLLWWYHSSSVTRAHKRGYEEGDKAGAERIQVQYDAFKSTMIRETEKAIKDAILSNQSLIAKGIQENANLSTRVTVLTGERDAALERLQHRPSRPVSSPGNSNGAGNAATGTPPSQCDGSGLYREDGEFLIREATTTKLISLNLKRCYQAIDDFQKVQSQYLLDQKIEVVDQLNPAVTPDLGKP